MRNSRHRSRNVGVRFNLSTHERHSSSWASLLVLCGGAAVLCGALVFAFDGKEPSPPPIESSTRGATAPTPISGQATRYVVRFEKCGRIRTTCVVDGDTFWLHGVKIRIADIDTPEISKPSCQAEYELGLRAKQRLIELLNEGEFSVATSSEWGEKDGFGRKLRLVVRDGVSVGERLVAEGLAHRWVGHKITWC